ncbi:unnamed protein product [Cylindrotheca closterium]|uniref:Uncharacterized protein n=1 Tax=Cylindrotheca closterium TaxID=2856 RepID=A0AAD2G054_9STRA|nr:unnamed protein product [Cylindrotheca closterium]
MVDAVQTTKLLLTVSGGLEDFAEKQLKWCFHNIVDLHWHKGPSGSQLYLTFASNSTVKEVADAVNRLDFVEYVFLQIDCFPTHASKGCTLEKEFSLLLREVETATSSISKSALDMCETISDAIDATRGYDVGMGGLTGALLPTPESLVDYPLGTHKVAYDSLDVNTIYTIPSAAQSIVKTVKNHVYNQPNTHCDENKILWIDAGSGNGAFLNHLPDNSSIGVDTKPQSAKVQQMDYLSLDRSWLEKKFPDHEKLFVISNPPFSLSSRGDYTPIVQFINYTFDILRAEAMAVICPSKFARPRIWKALGLTADANLTGRFFLPKNAYYNPSNGKAVDIHSYCLIFESTRTNRKNDDEEAEASSPHASPHGVYVSSKRDKSIFPGLATLDLTKAIATGLDRAKVKLVPERKARHFIQGKLEPSSLELWWHVNPNQPCSVVNSSSIKVPKHSLGWLSLSCKPGVALAMSSAAMNKTKSDEKCHVAIDILSGEGTVSLEACRAVSNSFFLLSGDKSFERSLKTKEHMLKLRQSTKHPLLVDVVVWDANALPIREDVADAVFADLPFQGSTKNSHQEPVVGGDAEGWKKDVTRPVSYSDILRHACRVLKPKGRAALLSPDFKALRHAAGKYHWNSLWHSKSVNLGGLSGKLYLMERQEASTKDLSMWVTPTTTDLSDWILRIAQEACSSEVSEMLPLLSLKVNPVRSVTLGSTYFHEKKKANTHCYRIEFESQIRNIQAKELEKLIRKAIEPKLLDGLCLR